MAAMSAMRASVIAAATAAAVLMPLRVQARLGGAAAPAANSTAASSQAFAGEWVPASSQEDLWRAEAAEAKLLKPSLFERGGAARGLAFWENFDNSSSDLVQLASSLSTVEALSGYEYVATTTRYGDTKISSCGSIDTAQLVAGTDYYAVASAQAMQSDFKMGGCCWCGEADGSCGHGTGTAPMGCSACAKGRFMPKRPYAQPVWADGAIFHEDINIVVADICPHVGNEAWCPQQAASENRFGSKNHFDFANPPPDFDNFYFSFVPVPCSAEMQQRLARMSQCHR